MDMEYGRYLSVSALSKYLSISKSYIYQNWDTGIFKKVRIYRLGKKILFCREDIDKFVKDKEVTV